MAAGWSDSSRYRDFDAAFAEDEYGQPKPLRIRLFGEEWTLPADPPAEVMLLRQRAVAAYHQVLRRQAEAAERGEETSTDELRQLLVDIDEDAAKFNQWDTACALLGEANLRAWFERGLKHSRLGPLVAWAQAAHEGRLTGEEDDGGDGGEGNAGGPDDGAEEPDPPATTSSPDGQRSTPTSSGSTDST